MKKKTLLIKKQLLERSLYTYSTDYLFCNYFVKFRASAFKNVLNPPRSCCTILKMWDLVKQFKKSVILTKRNHGYLLTFHDVIHIKLKELIAHRTRIRTPLPPTFSISWNKQEDLPPVLTLYAKNVVSTSIQRPWRWEDIVWTLKWR